MRTKSGRRPGWKAEVYREIEVEPGRPVRQTLGTYRLSPALPESRVLPEVRLLLRDDGLAECGVTGVRVRRGVPAAVGPEGC